MYGMKSIMNTNGYALTAIVNTLFGVLARENPLLLALGFKAAQDELQRIADDLPSKNGKMEPLEAKAELDRYIDFVLSSAEDDVNNLLELRDER